MADSVVNRSGTSTGASQTVAAANPLRSGFYIQNVSDTDMWIRFDGVAAAASQPSLKIPAGALYEMPANGVRLGAITLFCSAGSKGFTASEW